MALAGDDWQVEYVDPLTGACSGANRLHGREGRVQIDLPEFQGAIAIRLTRHQ